MPQGKLWFNFLNPRFYITTLCMLSQWKPDLKKPHFKMKIGRKEAYFRIFQNRPLLSKNF